MHLLPDLTARSSSVSPLVRSRSRLRPAPRLFAARRHGVLPAATILLLVALVAPPKLLQAETGKRKFRSIVPIKQSVAPGASGMKSRSVKVQIPPPPIPDVEDSLFPEGSVPALKISEDAVGLPPDAGETSSSGPEDSDRPPSPDSEEIEKEISSDDEGPTLRVLREEAHRLSELGLTYKFGADHPDEGGMDCSGAMQHLLSNIGIDGVPRTSYDQYYWLRKKKLIRDITGRNQTRKLLEKLSPGDLIFWGGTWKSGHKVSHVMIYLGYNPAEEKHYVFGARGRRSKGLTGNGVDVFELDPDRGRLVAHGKIPGLIYE